MRPPPKSRRGNITVGLWLGVVLTLLAVAFFAKEQHARAAVARPSFGLEDKDILLYMEALAKIHGNAAFLNGGATRQRIVEESIRHYLTQKDPSSDYLNRDEYDQFKKAQDDQYVGVGMEIKKRPDGAIVCLPHSESPAAKAGIDIGDELKEIDGVPVKGKSILTVASMARGKPGTKVGFVVTTKRGVAKEVKLSRSTLTIDSVALLQLGKTRVIKIHSFTRDTKDKLKKLVGGWQPAKPIIIDLRGNSGGDLHAAIDSAALFLSRGKRIVTIETRNGKKIYDSQPGSENETAKLYLWQDESTASAAEVFIAGLTENGRAVSMGRKSFGKGTVQEIIELSDRSAMVLTTGRLQTPRGLSYDGEGLTPTRPVAGDSAAYVETVEKLEGVKTTARKSG